MAKKEIVVPDGIIHEKGTYVCGLDIARRGDDETAFVVLEVLPFENVAVAPIFVTYVETIQKQSLTYVIGRALALHSIFNFKKMFVDTTGLGAGVTDILTERLPGIIEEFTFSRTSKSELFNNVKILMQQGRLKFPKYTEVPDANAKKLFYQFLSIQREYRGDSEIPRIYHDNGTHDDLVCSLALGCWYFKGTPRGRRGYTLAGGSSGI